MQKYSEKTASLLDEGNITKQNDTIAEICADIPGAFPDKISIGPNVLSDLDLLKWMKKHAASKGGKHVLQQIVSNPISNTDVLRERIQTIKSLPVDVSLHVKKAKNNESAVLWLLSLPTKIGDAWPLHLLFPSWPVVRYINHIPWIILCLHIYRSYISPFTNFIYPCSSLLAPYFYAKKYLKLNVRLNEYIRILKFVGTMMLRPSAGLKGNITKYGSVIMYIIMFVYGTVQSFQMANLVRNMRADISKKMRRISDLVATFNTHMSHIDVSSFSKELPATFDVGSDMSSFYKIMTDENARNNLTILLKRIYLIDAISAMKNVATKPGWSAANFGSETRLWGMGHPLLSPTRQVRNPISMDKNILITGPNAGGKTTYMKAICANTILSQSIGYVCAIKNVMNPVHAVSTSIRVHDSVGNDSLFQAEVRRCAAIVNEARNLSKNNMRAVYFMDEPMHSTPPIEGAATVMSIAKFMGDLKGIRLFMTTHYHEVTKLDALYPESWRNVSMEAVLNETTQSFTFPYRIRNGPSYQCIALEILKDRDLPKDIIDTAIEMKNKICEVVVDQYAS